MKRLHAAHAASPTGLEDAVDPQRQLLDKELMLGNRITGAWSDRIALDIGRPRGIDHLDQRIAPRQVIEKLIAPTLALMGTGNQSCHVD